MDIENIKFVDVGNMRLAYWCWGNPNSKKPVAVLIHGTAFVAATWRLIAEALSEDYTVYAFDRRGHGASGVPQDKQFGFRDFAEDLIGFMDGLGLKNVFGIGHSGGGTDMLLAAGMRQDLFERLFIMEPTVVNPDVPPERSGDLPAEYRAYIEQATKRRAVYPDREAVFARYSSRFPLNLWHPEILQDYIRFGFKKSSDGTVSLLCTPENESLILEPIMLAMINRYHGDSHGNPFVFLKHVDCPTVITSSAHSPLPSYKVMADIAAKQVQGAKRLKFAGLSHCVPQESPEVLIKTLSAFKA
ncbi:MAG: alpha/beta hydrolase [Rhodospirillales bacterium]|nr:alpha/beta hydrolase [Rhodospirillales bacterium]